jgi:hypothetical protein
MPCLNPAPLEEAAAWSEQQRALWTWRLGEPDKVLKEKNHG